MIHYTKLFNNGSLHFPHNLMSNTIGESQLYSEDTPIAISQELWEVRRTWQQKNISATYLFTIQLQQIAQIYDLREPVENIVQIFHRFPEILPLLTDVYYKVKSYFSDAQIFLQFVADIDATTDTSNVAGEPGDLVISIATSMPPAQAIERLTQFYDEWWLEVASDIKQPNIAFHLE